MSNCDTSGNICRDVKTDVISFIGITRYNVTSYLPIFLRIRASSYNEIKCEMSKLLLKYYIIRIYPDDFQVNY